MKQQKRQILLGNNIFRMALSENPSVNIFNSYKQTTLTKLTSMNRSRTRQFDEFRNNVSNNNSVKLEANSIRSSKVSQTTISEACVNCVNQIMAERHKKADKFNKQKQKEQFKKNIEAMNSALDNQSRYRQSLKKDALSHNSRMIQQQKAAKKHEKQQDLKYAQKMQKAIEQSEKMVKNEMNAQKIRNNQYYQQIHDQYVNQLQKKDRDRLHKQNLEGENQGLPLFNLDLTQQKMQYKKELQRQMDQKKRRQVEQKAKAQVRQKQLLQQSKKEADKYHADNYQSLKMSKQQVFGGLKNLEMEKKRKAEEDRKKKQSDRLRQIKQQNQYRSKAIKFKMDEMQKYVNGLKNQLLEKEQKLRMSKMTQSKFNQQIPKSSEEIEAQNQIKKTCKGCHKNYPQQLISPVPRKTD